MSSKKFQTKTATRATGVAASSSSKKEKLPTLGLRALNKFYIVEEDPIELTRDDSSGLNKDVIDALKSKRLVLPDIGEYMANKFPMRGIVVARGSQVTCEAAVGDRVMFSRMGGQRWQKNGKQMVTLDQSDLHAVLD